MCVCEHTARTARCRVHDRLAKPSFLNRAKPTVNDGTGSSHLSQLHLFHCWHLSVGQLIYGLLTKFIDNGAAGNSLRSSDSRVTPTQIVNYSYDQV